MKKLILTACAVMFVLGAQAQGYFTFNTRPDAAHQIKFTDASGNALTGPNYFVEVFAGTSANNLTALGSPLALNRTGTGAGLTSPFSFNYTTGIASGNAFIGYQAFEDPTGKGDITKATNLSPMVTTLDNKAGGTALSVALAVAPNLPNTVSLVTAPLTVGFAPIPEPTTLALGLIGLGSLLAIRRRK